MLSGIFTALNHCLWKAFFLLGVLTARWGHAQPICTSRRCLAEMLIGQNFSSQPQYENCTHTLYVPFMEYQTLSVDTKNLRLISRLQATIVWRDPELKWNTSVYNYEAVVLPVSKVWTPEIRVTNGITTTMQHSSNDLLVFYNGTVRHTVIINAEVNCEVNLFNYPFAADECPVAIQTWANEGCGTEMILGTLWMIDSTHGDWQTDSVAYQQLRNDRNYIMVSLSIRQANPFITLLLPSILIMLADMGSCALPLGGGERNAFKVTLVLSFTMFLIILNDQLPGDSKCSPIIRIHFCVCLVLLVLSMLVSLLLTRVAKDGLISCFWSKQSTAKNTGDRKKKEDEEDKPDITVIELNGSDENKQMLRKLLHFLESMEATNAGCERYEAFAGTLDKIFFWTYFILGSLYFCIMISVMAKHKCKVNHFDFWY